MRPTAYVISNFERWDGAEWQPRRDMTVTSVTLRRGVRLIVTGWKPAVPRFARRQLERSIERYSDQPAQIRHLLELANRRAAGSTGARGMISPECSVYSRDIRWTIRSERPGTVPGGPSSVFHGVDLSDMMDRVVKEIVGDQPIARRTLLAQSFRPVDLPRQSCSLTIVMPTDTDARAIMERPGLGHETVHARWINNNGSVVGNAGSPPYEPPIPWQYSNGEIAVLPIPGGSHGSAHCINDRDEVVGTVAGPTTTRLTHAWFWNVDEGDSHDLDGRPDHESGARAINASSIIVGHLRLGISSGDCRR